MNVNLWVGCGRLTANAEQTTTKKGTSMSKFRLAVNDRRNDDTLFLNVLCFGKMAESLTEHLVKGRLVSVQGKVKVDVDVGEIERLLHARVHRIGARGGDADGVGLVVVVDVVVDAYNIEALGHAPITAGKHKLLSRRHALQDV